MRELTKYDNGSKINSNVLKLQYFEGSIEPEDAHILADLLFGRNLEIEEMFAFLVKCDRNPALRQIFDYVVRARGRLGQLKVLSSLEGSIERINEIIENSNDEVVLKAVRLLVELYEKFRLISDYNVYSSDSTHNSASDIIGYIISKTKKIKGEKEDNELAETLIYAAER